MLRFLAPETTWVQSIKEINMSKSFRASLVAGLVLGLSQAGVAVAMAQTTAPAANAETTKSSASLKSKKKKKNKTVAPAVVVLGAYAQPTVPQPVSTAPVLTTPTDVPSTAPAPAPRTRGTVSQSKIGGISVSPMPEPPASVATAGQLVISEFRLHGANGVNDEFIEIANVSGADHTVAALSGTGYGVAASDGVTRCTIPNGTVIPNKGHYLCVNSVGYSLASYPAGNGTTATGDATYTADIPDNAGIARFNNNTGDTS